MSFIRRGPLRRLGMGRRTRFAWPGHFRCQSPGFAVEVADADHRRPRSAGRCPPMRGAPSIRRVQTASERRMHRVVGCTGSRKLWSRQLAGDGARLRCGRPEGSPSKETVEPSGSRSRAAEGRPVRVRVGGERGNVRAPSAPGGPACRRHRGFRTSSPVDRASARFAGHRDGQPPAAGTEPDARGRRCSGSRWPGGPSVPSS